MKHSTWRNSLISLITVVILLVIWQIASVIMDAQIILPRPLVVLQEFFSFFASPDSWLAIGATVLRSLRSFAIIMAAGLVLGIAAGQNTAFGAVMKPILSVIRATPVLAIILLAFLWFKTGTVPVFSAFLMGFPVLYQNLIMGLSKRDTKLLEMGRAYGLDGRQLLRYITIPSLLPFILAGARGALGMTWKVVIAAEVLTVPRYGVGSSMQYAQMNLETATVMGWTITAIVLTACGDLLFDAIDAALGMGMRSRRSRL
ncbi:MAG: ABC transporter permease subunit [Spirochaetia bacterium]|nr:ABC transporter permease subunit [Spirochaetia bacterium]